MDGTVCEDESAWVSLYGEILENRDKVDSGSSPLLGAGTDVQTITRGELRKFVEGSRSVDLEVRFDIPRRGILESIGDRKKGTEDQEIDMNQWVSLYRTQHSCMSTTSSLHPSIQVLVYHPQYSCSPPTLAMIILSILQIAFYIHHSHTLWSLDWDSIPATKAPTCSLLIYNPEKRGQIWRFLTYQFVHVGLEHVCFNIIMQLAVGVPLEMSQMGWMGTARVLTVYLSGVTLGSLGGTLPNPSLYLAGASAGVYALIAAHLATLVLNWKEDGEVYRGRKREDKKVAASLAPMVRWIRLLAVTLFTLFDVSYAIYNYYTGVRTATGYMGHFCGAISGLLVGLVVLENRRVETWERWLKVSSICVYTCLLIGSMTWHIVGSYTGFFPSPQSTSSQCQYYTSSTSSTDHTHL